jgi:hypothetical protein
LKEFGACEVNVGVVYVKLVEVVGEGIFVVAFIGDGGVLERYSVGVVLFLVDVYFTLYFVFWSFPHHIVPF